VFAGFILAFSSGCAPNDLMQEPTATQEIGSLFDYEIAEDNRKSDPEVSISSTSISDDTVILNDGTQTVFVPDIKETPTPVFSPVSVLSDECQSEVYQMASEKVLLEGGYSPQYGVDGDADYWLVFGIATGELFGTTIADEEFTFIHVMFLSRKGFLDEINIILTDESEGTIVEEQFYGSLATDAQENIILETEEVFDIWVPIQHTYQGREVFFYDTEYWNNDSFPRFLQDNPGIMLTLMFDADIAGPDGIYWEQCDLEGGSGEMADICGMAQNLSFIVDKNEMFFNQEYLPDDWFLYGFKFLPGYVKHAFVSEPFDIETDVIQNCFHIDNED